MTAIPAADLPAQLADVLARVRRGESVLLVEDGRPVACITPAGPQPAPAATETTDMENEAEERPWRGVFAMEVGKTAIPGFALPDQPVVLKRQLPDVNLDWFRSHDDTDD